jgi:hypothetical protein
MRLSDAIRLGSTLGPQCFGQYTISGDNGSCALGAAILAVDHDEEDVSQLLIHFPELLLRVVCPDSGTCLNLSFSGRRDFRDVIVHLNDTHRWTREAIADWVDQVCIEQGYVHQEETIQQEPNQIETEELVTA